MPMKADSVAFLIFSPKTVGNVSTSIIFRLRRISLYRARSPFLLLLG